MARKAAAWYWEEKHGWYVNHQGKRHRLGEHPTDAPPPKKSNKTGLWNLPKSIQETFHKLLGTDARHLDDDAVALVLDDFIDWCFKERADLTARRYQDFCDDFVKSYGTLPVGKLTSKEVTKWLNDHKEWNSTTRRNAITALQRGFNWATKNRGLSRNPIRGMEKPEAKRGGSILTPTDFETILKHVLGPFADLLTVSYDCGARPFEVKDMERRHLELERQRAVIPADEAKGRKYTRTIYFPTERSIAIIKRLAKERPEGPLFLNSKGNKWTGNAVKCGFQRLDEVLGKRVKHYDFRRTFITRKIIAGVDSHVVAKLSGHQSTAMIDKHYSAVADDHEFMLSQATRDITSAKGA